MNVTRSNFKQALPTVYDSLKKSSFVALDFEFTGVVSHELLRNSNIDSVSLQN